MGSVKYLFILLLFIFFLPGVASPQEETIASTHAISEEDSIRINQLYSEIKEYKRKDLGHAIKLAEEALILSKQSGNQNYIAISTRKVAQLYNANGQADLAITYYDTAIIIFKTHGLKKGLSYSYNNLGSVYLHTGNIENAFINFQKSLALGEELNDSIVICTGYNNFGNIYYNQYDYANAISNYQKAYSIAEKINKTSWLGDYAANLGNAYYMQGNHQSALEYYEKAIGIHAQTKNIYGTAQVLSSVGQVFESEGNYSQAIGYYQKSLNLKEKLQDTHGISESLTNIASMYNNMGEYDKSVSFSFKSLEISEPSGLSEQMKCSYENLYISYSQKNEIDKAMEYLTQYKDMEKEIFVQANNETIARLQTQYETEKKEKEIALLTHETETQKLLLLKQENFRNILFLVIIMVIIVAAGLLHRYLSKKKMNLILINKNQEIEKQKIEVDQLNKNLEEINTAKDKFFAIISHDLKNPINLLSLSTAHMLRNLYETDKSKLEFYLTNMNKSANSLELLLKNLLNWAQNQLGTLKHKPQKTDILKLAINCVKELEPFAVQKGISLNTNIKAATFALADEEMIRTVIRNIVSNAIKFTSNGGTVEIFAKQSSENIEINIRDNGTGMTEETISRLFQISQKESALGTANEKGTGLGLVLCKELIEKNNGTLKIESSLGKGSIIGFTLPMYEGSGVLI